MWYIVDEYDWLKSKNRKNNFPCSVSSHNHLIPHPDLETDFFCAALLRPEFFISNISDLQTLLL